MAEDDGPPPLEDMSDYLKEKQTKAAAVAAAPAQPTTAAAPAATASSTAGDAKSAAKKPVAAAASSTTTAAASFSSSSSGGGMFGGLKGGFFNNKPPAASVASTATTNSAASAATTASSSTSASTDGKRRSGGGLHASDIQNITTPGAAKSGDSSLRIPEVQEKLKEKQPSWLNNDLLTRVASNPVLFKGLQNPKIVRAMAEIQSDAAAAQRKYGADKEIGGFIKEFMSLMGNHLEQLSDKQIAEEKKKAAAAAAASAASAAAAAAPSPPVKKGDKYVFGERAVDERTLQQWMSHPTIRAVLSDPGMTAIINDLAQDRTKWTKYSSHPGVKLLVQAGILQIPPEYRL